MTAQTFSTLQATMLANVVKAQPPYNVVPPDFAQIFSHALSYAETRIYTDIPLIANRQQNSSLMTSPGSRTIPLAGMVNTLGGPIILPEGFSLIANGARVPFDFASLDVIDLIWPVESVVVAPSISDWGVPRYWAMRDDHTIVYCPTADASYVAEITGLFQPTPMSATNPTTYVGNIYPQLLEAGCMVWLTGALLHNFGSQSDNPQRAMSWENTYQTLMHTAKAEEFRRRGLAPEHPSQPAPGTA